MLLSEAVGARAVCWGKACKRAVHGGRSRAGWYQRRCLVNVFEGEDLSIVSVRALSSLVSVGCGWSRWIQMLTGFRSVQTWRALLNILEAFSPTSIRIAVALSILVTERFLLTADELRDFSRDGCVQGWSTRQLGVMIAIVSARDVLFVSIVRL